jgi:hypothetical protein
MCYNQVNIMTQDITGGLIAIIVIALIILIPAIAAIIIQIKFIGLHKDINRMLTNPSQLINNMYFSFVPWIGSVVFFISIIKMRNRLNQEFEINNFKTNPKSNIFAALYLGCQILGFVLSVISLISSNSTQVGLVTAIFGICVIDTILYFVYWVHLYEDKVKLFIAKN